MRHLIVEFVLCFVLCASNFLPPAAGETAMLNAFNAGEVSPMLDGRTDTERYYRGCRTLTNLLAEPWGDVTKRPGTYYIATAPGSQTTVTIIEEVAGTYPTLQVADGTFATAQADPGLAHTTAVSSLNDLQNMQNNLAGNYYLTGDIDASATSGWNGGAGFAPIETFTGTFDGCGYTISNLTINRETEGTVGLFGTTLGAKFANVILSNVTITGLSYVGSLVGFLASEATHSALVQNCHVSGEIQVKGSSHAFLIGGLIGYSQGGPTYSALVYDCTSSVVVDGKNHHTINGILNLDQLGGLIGSSTYSTISNCRASGDVLGVVTTGEGASNVGGLISRITNNCLVTDCKATGNVEGGDLTGGFAGTIFASVLGSTTVQRCVSTGSVTATSLSSRDCITGGFSGNINSWLTTYSATLEDCYSWSNVVVSVDTGVAYAGAFSGYTFRSLTTLTNCYCIGTLTGAATSYAFRAGSIGIASPAVTAIFWDTEASGISDNGTWELGEGHITSWMKTQANYTAAGWDFTTTWEMTDYQAAGTETTTVSWLTHNRRLFAFDRDVGAAHIIEAGDRYFRFYK